MFPATLIIEFVCLICAFVFLKNINSYYWKSFILFMFLITLLEAAGWIIAAFYKQNNHWLYNIQLPIEFIFTSFCIYKIISSITNSKPWFLLGLSISLIFYIVEGVYKTFLSYASVTSIFTSILFFVSSAIYFYLLLKKEEHIDLLSHPPFWIMAGIFFFYFTSIAVTLFFKELMTINILKGIPLRFYIFTLLNAILYGCWIKAFKCKYLQIK
jgi:hypothetical protein